MCDITPKKKIRGRSQKGKWGMAGRGLKGNGGGQEGAQREMGVESLESE